MLIQNTGVISKHHTPAQLQFSYSSVTEDEEVCQGWWGSYEDDDDAKKDLDWL